MRIGDPNVRETGAARTEQTGGIGRPPAQAEGGSQAAADQVQLSRLAKRVAETLKSQEPENVARLEQLRQAYQAGKYQVDVAALSRKIADEIVAETSRGLEP
ncbi:MAG: flagellar biosynthesis anti-sigma factor FlgM [Bryobacterales bacterium]|nr:flagellar biosynthesis anti-sigma factor FlgM [Bryobacteraceae bacterium]MDW8355250.1 flagellar biosynthesis anti-sigma factor FlgM [Bryobacterales bacterium]